jgi:hypothetical protein
MTSRNPARLSLFTSRTLRAAILSGGALLSVCSGATAQFAFEEEMLPPRVVAWRLADRGFTGLSRPRFDGRVYVVDAVGPAGGPVRLFVDPATGAIVGRQRMSAPDTYARLERPAPGFGWTEEEAVPRRVVRPVPGEDGPSLRVPRRPGGEALRPDPNPDAVNPDSVGRSAPPRKLARVAPARPTDLKATHRTAPEAPAPRIAPAEAAKSEPAPKADTKSASIDKAPSASPAAPATAPPKPAEGSAADASKAAAKDWKDPPSDRKPVRVIGGATIVPGTTEKESGAGQ